MGTIIDQQTGEIVKFQPNTDLQLSGFRLTKTGLIAENDPCFEEWQALGPTLNHIGGAVHWWIGDWLNFGEHKWGEKYVQAVGETGFDYITLANDAWVANKIEFSRRRENLSWGHHCEVAARKPEEQDYWLDRALQGDDGKPWSIRELRRMIKAQPWLSSESTEWYTPPQYIEAARAVLGHFDVDPASNETAQQIIQAKTYYTAQTNGLDKDWPGKVWLNPPYGGLSGPFAARLVEQFEAGIVEEAILLVNSNSTDTNWFAPLWNYLLCFTDHRIDFQTPEGTKNGSTHGSVFVYFGPHRKRFFEEFQQFGYVMAQIRPE